MRRQQSSVLEFRDQCPLSLGSNSRHLGAGEGDEEQESRRPYCVMRLHVLTLSSEYGAGRRPTRSRVLLLHATGLREGVVLWCVRQVDVRKRAQVPQVVQSVDRRQGTQELAQLLRIGASQRDRYYKVSSAQIYESRVPDNADDIGALRVERPRAAIYRQAYLYEGSVDAKFFSI